MTYDEEITRKIVRKYRLTAIEFNLALRQFIENKTGHKLPEDVVFYDYYRPRGGFGVELDKEDYWDGVEASVVVEDKIR